MGQRLRAPEDPHVGEHEPGERALGTGQIARAHMEHPELHAVFREIGRDDLVITP